MAMTWSHRPKISAKGKDSSTLPHSNPPWARMDARALDPVLHQIHRMEDYRAWARRREEMRSPKKERPTSMQDAFAAFLKVHGKRRVKVVKLVKVALNPREDK
jgi:hypothetical protein